MRNFYDEVKEILIEMPLARDDDYFLYAVFLCKFKYVSMDEKFYDVMVSAKAKHLPSYESITRTRRKVQENMPELQGIKRKDRKHEEETYHAYYRRNKEANQHDTL